MRLASACLLLVLMPLAAQGFALSALPLVAPPAAAPQRLALLRACERKPGSSLSGHVLSLVPLKRPLVRAPRVPPPSLKLSSAFFLGMSASDIMVLTLCCAIGAVCALDRVMLSVAILPMSMEYGFSDSTKGLVAAAFSLGYCVGLLPAGLLSAISSPKAVLGCGLVLWSVAQAATPMAAATNPSK